MLRSSAARRDQERVDRRFNRRRHDAGRMVAGFAVRLRGQVDLDLLSAELAGVVEQTVQRSSSAPASRPNSSQGSHPANMTADAGSGSRVRVAASSGRAVR
jgi:hypothetical protein